jgi:hypothetical protein
MYCSINVAERNRCIKSGKSSTSTNFFKCLKKSVIKGAGFIASQTAFIVCVFAVFDPGCGMHKTRMNAISDCISVKRSSQGVVGPDFKKIDALSCHIYDIKVSMGCRIMQRLDTPTIDTSLAGTSTLLRA